MRVPLHHRPSARSLALALLTVALLVAATIAAAFTREAELEAARAMANAKPLLLVAGATGPVGLLIAQRATDDGLAVRAAAGDLRNARAAGESVRGAEFVIVGLGNQVWAGPESVEFVGYRALVNLVNAARTTRVRHFVLISSVSAGMPTDESFQSRAGQMISWKTKAEEHLKASGVPYTIVRLGAVRSGPAGATGLRAVRREDYQHASVSSGDVARVAIDVLRNPMALQKSFALFNDAAAAPDSWRKELYAVTRDAPVGAALRRRPGAEPPAVPGSSRYVAPAQRERLMIEDEAAGETPPVEWIPPSASSQ